MDKHDLKMTLCGGLFFPEIVFVLEKKENDVLPGGTRLKNVPPTERLSDKVLEQNFS